MIPDSVRKKYYGGPRYNGTKAFYDQVRGQIAPDSVVLNLGAGPATRSPVRTLRGEVAEVVGADIDPIVLDNPECDRAVLIENGTVPLPDAQFDLIYSDFVLEHVEKPSEFLAEVFRLLKDGGSFMFRTPNLYHYVALISRFTPHWFHKKVANKVRNLDDDAHEPWPTFYRLNSAAALRRHGRAAGFAAVNVSLHEFEPSYLYFARGPFYVGLAYERAVNATPLLEGLRVNILGRMTKPAARS